MSTATVNTSAKSATPAAKSNKAPKAPSLLSLQEAKAKLLAEIAALETKEAKVKIEERARLEVEIRKLPALLGLDSLGTVLACVSRMVKHDNLQGYGETQRAESERKTPVRLSWAQVGEICTAFVTKAKRWDALQEAYNFAGPATIYNKCAGEGIDFQSMVSAGKISAKLVALIDKEAKAIADSQAAEREAAKVKAASPTA